MDMTTLKKIVERPKKRVGRGHGSGKVKTAGRGTKGQKSRGTVRFGFEGGQLPLVKRLPLLRGKGRNKSRSLKVLVLPVEALNAIGKDSTISLESLRKYHMIPEGANRVKVVGKGKLAHAFSVELPCSQSAQASIEKAGGKLVAHE